MSNAAVYPINPFAPLYLQGLNQPLPEEVGFKDKYFDYVYEPASGEIPASTTSFSDVLPIDQDADFYITAILLSKVGANFLVQIVDASGYEITDGFVSADTLSFTSQNPTQQMPAHPMPAGSKLTLRFHELTGEAVPLQITFKGYKRFRRPVRGEQ